MKQGERLKKRISLMLLMVLCLVGVYGADSAADVPVYTSVSCALIAAQHDASVTGQDGAKDKQIPVERFYQDCIAGLPEAEGPLERVEQDRITVLLERCRQDKRSDPREIGIPDSCVARAFIQPAGTAERLNAAGTALSGSRSRIISYIHDQDGQKGRIL